MPGKQARLLSESYLKRALGQAAASSHPERNAVIILLSARAGLRACEIARLEWSMVLNANGRIAPYICVEDRIAKKRGGRRVPIHPELRQALWALLRETAERRGPVIRSARGGGLRPNSLVNWFREMFASIGAEGCSSHSGRRTFITHAARRAHKAGASLRDVQLLAGHRSIEVTQGYIDGDTEAQRRLVMGL